MEINQFEVLGQKTGPQLCGLNSLYVALKLMNIKDASMANLFKEFPSAGVSGVSLKELEDYCLRLDVYVRLVSLNEIDIAHFSPDIVVLSLEGKDTSPHIVVKKKSSSGSLMIIDYDAPIQINRKTILNVNETACLVLRTKPLYLETGLGEIVLFSIVLLMGFALFISRFNRVKLR